MTLPIHHPIWASLYLVIPVAVLSALLVSIRSRRLASGPLATVLDSTRADGAFAFGVISACAGIALSVSYAWLADRWPQPTPWLFLVGSLMVAGFLTVFALRIGVHRGLGGARELVALNVLWALAYGVGLPLLLGSRHLG